MEHFFFCAKIRVRAALFALVAAMVFVAACSWVIDGGGEEDPPLRVSFLDVGQGLAVLLEHGGRFAMYDMGPDSAGVIDSLVARGVDSLEWVLLGHNHRDHAGGFMELARRGASSGVPRVHVCRLFVGPDTGGGFVRDSVLRMARRFSIPVDTVYRGDVLGLVGSAQSSDVAEGSPVCVAGCGRFSGIGDALRFDVLWPPDYVQEDGNPASAVVHVEYGAGSMLLTGDLDTAGERRLLELSPTLTAGLLQVPHHGSLGSSSLRFVAQVAPEYAVVSVGQGNSYGHPRESVVRKYAYVLGDTSFFFRTDLQGSIEFEMWRDMGVVPGRRGDK